MYSSTANYVPDFVPINFEQGEIIFADALEMTSTLTHLPLEYYSLPFGLPKNGTSNDKAVRLSAIFRSSPTVSTSYELRMAENTGCKLLRKKKGQPLEWNPVESRKAIHRILNEYRVHL